MGQRIKFMFYIRWNKDFNINFIFLHSTIMSKAKITKPKVIQDSEEESDSSVPIVAAKTSKKQQVEEKKVVKKQVQPESSEEEDTPVVAKKPTKQVKVEVPAPKKVVAKKPVKPQSSEQEESEEQKPKKVVAKVKSPVQKPIVKKPVVQSSEEESQEEVKPKAKVVQKVVSPVQKPVVKKVVKKVESSQEQSEEQVKKPVLKVKSPVQKVKSPILKAKSPVQKPLASKKKVASSSEQESQEKPQPKKNAKKAVVQSQQDEEPVVVKKAQKAVKKVEQTKMVPEDEQGQFEACVRGLSFNAYDSDIRDFFSECGNVSNVKLLTRDDGKSKGVAFVKFSKKSSFNAALELNGSQHLGRSLTIEQSQGKKPAAGGAFGGAKDRSYGAPEGNANIETPTLFIGGISYNSTVESITSFFSQTGDVASARIVTDRQTGKPRGFGYVEFHDVDTAKRAYKELNGGNLDGRTIRLDSAAQRDRPQGGDRGGFGGGRGSFGGGSRGGFGGSSFGGGRGAPRNPGNSTVVLSQDDKNAKKGSIGTFAGKKMAL